LREPVALLERWNRQSAADSIATTLAIEWGERLQSVMLRSAAEARRADSVALTHSFAAAANPQDLLQPLSEAVRALEAKYGTWKMPWGEVNRYQRLTGRLEETYDDKRPSLPVGFTSSNWGMLPAYSSRTFPGTQKRYGVSGNSFICAVEFGKIIRARSLLAGGQSGNPASPHFGDQASMYAEGRFKEVWFYKQDVQKHVERRYQPGQ
jgi:acyl-homoserine lactone acylase PvdQ